jgi:hypothetical protein
VRLAKEGRARGGLGAWEGRRGEDEYIKDHPYLPRVFFNQKWTILRIFFCFTTCRSFANISSMSILIVFFLKTYFLL